LFHAISSPFQLFSLVEENVELIDWIDLDTLDANIHTCLNGSMRTLTGFVSKFLGAPASYYSGLWSFRTAAKCVSDFWILATS
jgi:hypothetical protein